MSPPRARWPQLQWPWGAAPSVPRGHTVVAAHEFLVGLHRPLRRRVRLPESFAAIYGGRFPPGIWLQRDDCPNGPSWVCLEVGDTGRLELTKGWWTFAHAQRLQTDQILLFRYNRSEEHTSELQSHYSISYAVFCLKKIFF